MSSQGIQDDLGAKSTNFPCLSDHGVAGWLVNLTDHGVVNIGSTSVWSCRAGVNLGDVANYQS